MISFKKYQPIVLALVLAVIFFLLILFFSFQRESGKTGFFRQVVLETAIPLQMMFLTAVDGIQNMWQRYIFLVGLEEENRKLRERIALLGEDMNRVREMRIEYDRLRSLMGLKENAVFPTIAARVVTRDRAALFKSFIIDRGSRYGVAVGSPVLVAEGVVGKVMEVSLNRAKVLLINDYNCRIDAYIQETRIHGILEGYQGLECTLKYVTGAEVVREGDTVITSGLAGVFPKGLVLGTVVYVRKCPDDLFQEIRVRPAANIDRIEEVLVVIGKESLEEGNSIQ